jgi:hypothetical protein
LLELEPLVAALGIDTHAGSRLGETDEWVWLFRTYDEVGDGVSDDPRDHESEQPHRDGGADHTPSDAATSAAHQAMRRDAPRDTRSVSSDALPSTDGTPPRAPAESRANETASAAAPVEAGRRKTPSLRVPAPVAPRESATSQRFPAAPPMTWMSHRANSQPRCSSLFGQPAAASDSPSYAMNVVVEEEEAAPTPDAARSANDLGRHGLAA